MSDKFFESEIVIHALEDIMVLQSEVLMFSQYALYATLEEQRLNVKTLRTLLSKQKNMFFRCMLSESPAAKELMAEIIDHFQSCGIENTGDPMEMFDLMAISIDEIENDLNQEEERH